jgi:hypothetical protein
MVDVCCLVFFKKKNNFDDRKSAGDSSVRVGTLRGAGNLNSPLFSLV